MLDRCLSIQMGIPPLRGVRGDSQVCASEDGGATYGPIERAACWCSDAGEAYINHHFPEIVGGACPLKRIVVGEMICSAAIADLALRLSRDANIVKECMAGVLEARGEEKNDQRDPFLPCGRREILEGQVSHRIGR